MPETARPGAIPPCADHDRGDRNQCQSQRDIDAPPAPSFSQEKYLRAQIVRLRQLQFEQNAHIIMADCQGGIYGSSC
jgi:hypothetical protein